MNEFLFERIADLLSLRLILGALGILVGLLRLILDFFHDWVEACKFISTSPNIKFAETQQKSFSIFNLMVISNDYLSFLNMICE
jgi:hypothetical protein